MISILKELIFKNEISYINHNINYLIIFSNLSFINIKIVALCKLREKFHQSQKVSEKRKKEIKGLQHLLNS